MPIMLPRLASPLVTALLLVGLLPAPHLVAAEPAAPPVLTPAETEYLTLANEFRDQLDKFWEQGDKITEPRAVEEFYATHDPAIEYVPKLLAFEREHGGEDAGLDALSEVILYAARGGGQSSPGYKGRREALARLPRYEDRALAARAISSLTSGDYDPQVVEYLHRLADSPQADPTVRTTAQLRSATQRLSLLARQQNSAQSLQDFQAGMPTRFPDEVEWFRKSLADLPPAGQLAADRDQAIRRLETVAAADDSLRSPAYLALDPRWILVRIDPEKTATSPSLAEQATALLFKYRHLQPGQTAPELELKLIDGRPWSLVAQRGQPVVIQFCFTGCGPCEEMYPQLGKLHEERGDQLALITILRDDTPDNGFEDAKTGKITWPIACDGNPGEVCTRWAVESFPTTYLIDATGRIAAYGLRGEQLEWKVKQLLAN
jgi:peroxiredoxin